MNSKRLSDEEILKIKSDYYNMEQLLKYVKFLEKGIIKINNILHKSNLDKNWYEAQEISDKLMEHI
jgi:hypothetical protein